MTRKKLRCFFLAYDIGMLLVVSFSYIITVLPLVLVSIILEISLQTNRKLAAELFFKLYNVSNILGTCHLLLPHVPGQSIEGCNIVLQKNAINIFKK